MGERAAGVDVRRRAGWLPTGQADLETWLADLQRRADARADEPLHPSVAELAALVDADPVLRMYVDRMVVEAPRGKPYERRPVTGVDQLFSLVDTVLTTAPEFSSESMVMTPLNAVLDWPMGTTAGFAAMRDPRFNAGLKKVLRAWCDFLSGPASCTVLNDSPSGWLGPEARATIGLDDFEHDPDAEHGGFGSWNAFFTRRFKPGRRPVADPDDDAVVVSPCESTPYGISRDVRRRDEFWVKEQSYSLHELLAGDPCVDDLVGGTVYQAYLSATNYHRWHAPVAGTVVRSFVVDGTYFSEADSEGADALEPQNSQGYMAHVATRAVLVLEADDPAIGLVAFVAVGMSDVSSCVFGPEAAPGRHLAKGAETGYFQFGGSTCCLVFRPGVIDAFALDAVPQPHDPSAPLVHVGARLATVARR